jgi:hypothetical protein
VSPEDFLLATTQQYADLVASCGTLEGQVISQRARAYLNAVDHLHMSHSAAEGWARAQVADDASILARDKGRLDALRALIDTTRLFLGHRDDIDLAAPNTPRTT